ncbi:MAG TPA: glycosyltransferase family 2 protein [Bryobacteraceae bacterium]|jgi:glycosyltransferase involved in cell wall biosynthesis|nr:glycosyltransferase family 2 protein [Bryobacteraceae bacterium]
MNITGMLRVRDEARWIERVIASIQPLCTRIVVMDDHSVDGTRELCARIPGVEALRSPFEGLDEARDKNWLLDQVGPSEWILAIDGDEVLAPGAQTALFAAMNSPATCLSLPILYLWDSEDQIRVDGVYGRFRRESAFRPNGARFESTRHGGNFHCGNVPSALRGARQPVNAPLLHLGYMNREDRLRKFSWYNEQDPGNAGEDSYRHVVQGDIPEVPATATLRHAGPLQLEALCSRAA